MTRTLTRLSFWTLLALPVAYPAFAVLGGDETSVDADRTAMKGELRAKTTLPAGYTVHELQTPAGTTVREYVSPEGKVFEVTWRGPAKPDLRSLLGPYFQDYVDDAAAHPGVDRHHLQIRRPALVVSSEGHMRALFGRAYLPALVPQGVSVEDLQ